MKNACMAFVALCLLTSLALPVMADTAYRPYDNSEWSDELAAPNVYVPLASYSGLDMGCDVLDEPTDIFAASDGKLYIVDTGNDRIIVTDETLQMAMVVEELTVSDGQTARLRKPSATYVTEEAIYIADTGNERCIKVDFEGRLLQEWTIPQNNTYTSDTFEPLDLLVDTEGTVYVLARNISQGLLQYSAQGEFLGYFGSPRVTASFQLLWDRFWKNMLSDAQRDELSRYVPVEYSGLAMDEQDFIYACLSYTDNEQEQIRRLNHLGNNVLAYTENFGENQRVDYKRETWYTQFVDVAVENDFIYALDSQWQRIYLFSKEGRRLGVFGTLGEQMGSFRNATALTVYGQRVYVLDKNKGNVTAFEPTEYGGYILQAVSLYNKGNYQEAMEPWQSVLAMNTNSELAYDGIGEAYLKTGDYAQAVKHFRLAYNRERESVAFGYWRDEFIRSHVGWFLGGLLVLLLAVLLFTNKRFLAYLRTKCHPTPSEQLTSKQKNRRNVLSVYIKPVESFSELKNVRYQSGWLVFAVLAAWLLIKIIKRSSYGFRFNMNDPDEFSIFIQLASTVGLFLLFVVANWAVCALTDGEGKFGEIATGVAISLVPYLIFTAVCVPLSIVLTLKETVFLNTIEAVGLLWTLTLLFQSQRIMHDFSGGKTIGMAFLTVCGIAVMLVILLLLFSLGQQVVHFFSSVISELTYRK